MIRCENVMKRWSLILCTVCVFSVMPVFGQTNKQDEATANRLLELLRHPTFIRLRVSTPNFPSREKPTDAPAPYQEKSLIDFQLFITQNSTDTLTILDELDPYYEYRPELMQDGEIVPYSKAAQEGVRIADTQPHNGSSKEIVMQPGREYETHYINLDKWYAPLQPGRYQLKIRKRFVWNGDWVESNPLIFDVLPRKHPEAIPDGVSIRLAPSGLQPSTEEKLYRLTADVRVAVFVVNNSDKPLKAYVMDLYYRNRLQLFKDGSLMPYRKETANLIRSKDENPYRVETIPGLVLDPNTATSLLELRLSDWYEPLGPGVYRLIIRQRFEINGPWTADSVPLLFEIPAK